MDKTTQERLEKLIETGWSLYQGDHLHFFLCLGCATRIRHSPEFAQVAIQQIKSNIKNLESLGKKTKNDLEWETLLETKSAIEIADILESTSDESQRLRSNFRGYQVIPEEQRFQIIDELYGPRNFSPTHFYPR